MALTGPGLSGLPLPAFRSAVILGGPSPAAVQAAPESAAWRAGRWAVLPAAPLLLRARRRLAQRGAGARGVRVCCAPNSRSRLLNEEPEEAIRRLSHEIHEAIASDDARRASQAQRELRKIQLDRPSVACRHLIHEDVTAAATLLYLGERASVRGRVNAVKKLSRWLRWPHATNKDLVPVATALEGLLSALRSEPEVAWAAQCALFHVVRCHSARSPHNVKETTRGQVTRLLLEANVPFPFCLPELTERAAEAYETALRASPVRSFFARLKELTLIDPGYGESWQSYDLALFRGFAQRLGKCLVNLRALKVMGFEDCAMKLVLPTLWMPKLRQLHIFGCCQQRQSRAAILSLVNRNRLQLEELELNLWTEFLHEAEDPVLSLEKLPKVKRLSLHVPLLPAWQHFGDLCPLLEELTFVYSQDIALNAARVLVDSEPGEEEEILVNTSTRIYRDAVRFAAQLQSHGFAELAEHCPRLQVIRFKMWDNSFGYDSTAAKEHFTVCWRRSERSRPGRAFLRDADVNNATRATLEAKAAAAAWSEWDEDEGREVTEEEALAAAACVMLQVLRRFDDPSLEAELGL
ncbi:unnamed protein product [Effrenium voratum]|nr:unnamed protein product [Effrenium voratum]